VTDANGDGRPDLAVDTEGVPGTVMLAIDTPGWDNGTAGAVRFTVSAP
jgi:hypothetical protein